MSSEQQSDEHAPQTCKTPANLQTPPDLRSPPQTPSNLQDSPQTCKTPPRPAKTPPDLQDPPRPARSPRPARPPLNPPRPKDSHPDLQDSHPDLPARLPPRLQDSRPDLQDSRQGLQDSAQTCKTLSQTCKTPLQTCKTLSQHARLPPTSKTPRTCKTPPDLQDSRPDLQDSLPDMQDSPGLQDSPWTCKTLSQHARLPRICKTPPDLQNPSEVLVDKMTPKEEQRNKSFSTHQSHQCSERSSQRSPATLLMGAIGDNSSLFLLGPLSPQQGPVHTQPTAAAIQPPPIPRWPGMPPPPQGLKRSATWLLMLSSISTKTQAACQLSTDTPGFRRRFSSPPPHPYNPPLPKGPQHSAGCSPSPPGSPEGSPILKEREEAPEENRGKYRCATYCGLHVPNQRSLRTTSASSHRGEAFTLASPCGFLLSNQGNLYKPRKVPRHASRAGLASSRTTEP
ncbi:cyclin-K-like [Salvelinus sp. IW2-2015]|uniref:cyclin-K-like n=1 Tax=Salvelinus sp. IW2-2015 TaxID=2691554 RepID=UPI0038D3B498